MSIAGAEEFTSEEREVLARYFTNLDGPVFALVNLPEVVKGALFARYSRSSKSLRRLFLDEFFGELDVAGDTSLDASVGLRRAEELYARVFSEYGDDSVAQLGAVHLACEQSSNVLTKVLERGRIMSYLEQSTRYIPYDSRLPSGHYRYHRDQAVLESPLGARYVGEMDRMFDTYGELLPALQAFVLRENPRHGGVSELAHRHAVRARCLDALRGLLPAGSLSNVGIFGSGQSYEQLLLRMRAHPLPEARRYADLMLVELRKVIPSFLARIDRAERGGVWTEYLRDRREAMEEAVHVLWPVGVAGAGLLGHPHRLRPRRRGQGARGDVLPVPQRPRGRGRPGVAALRPEERRTIVQAYIGERSNRRHRPGRALERTAYRFDIVSDYGAFRDLQRHRMLTVEWQPLGTDLGFEVPESRGGCGPSDRRSGVARALEEPPRRTARLLPRAERLRRRAGVQHPFRPAVQRPGGDARPRAALRAPGPSRLPPDCPADAPAHRRAGGPPGHRRGHDVRGPHRDGARSSRG